MDKQAAYNSLKTRCFEARMPIYEVCQRAKVAASTVYRWEKRPNSMNASTLGKLERALDAIEQERGK